MQYMGLVTIIMEIEEWLPLGQIHLRAGPKQAGAGTFQQILSYQALLYQLQGLGFLNN